MRNINDVINTMLKVIPETETNLRTNLTNFLGKENTLNSWVEVGDFLEDALEGNTSEWANNIRKIWLGDITFDYSAL